MANKSVQFYLCNRQSVLKADLQPQRGFLEDGISKGMNLWSVPHQGALVADREARDCTAEILSTVICRLERVLLYICHVGSKV